MSQATYIAVVLEGGLVQSIMLEAWPAEIPLPRIVVVDYDTEGADEDELTSFMIGAEEYEAACHVVEPSLYERFDAALSPRSLLAPEGEAEISPAPSPPETDADAHKRS